MDVKAHCIVSGVVQGVGYRLFVLKLARHLKLKGWVRNLYTGEVETEVEGDRGVIDLFIQTLRTGNPHATVRHIAVDFQPYIGRYTGFDITY